MPGTADGPPVAAITFVAPDGRRVTVHARSGISVMEAARSQGVPGIEAQCGGECCCGTCHAYLEPEWLAQVGSAPAHERDLLDFAWEPRATSRLTCQIAVDGSLDGLVVHVPERQF